MSDTTTTLTRNKWMFWKRRKTRADKFTKDESFFRAGQWQLVWWKFRRHKLAQIAVAVLAVFYFIALFAEFVSPNDPQKRFKEFKSMPPTQIHIRDSQGNFHLPFVYAITRERDPITLLPVYTEDTTTRLPIKLFARGDEYKFWRLITSNIHLFGVEPEGDLVRPIFLLGSDTLGRDVLSRIFFGGRISLTVGLVGVFLAFILGIVLGGIAGFFGGVVDEVIMRIIDVLIALPLHPFVDVACSRPATGLASVARLFLRHHHPLHLRLDHPGPHGAWEDAQPA